MPLYRARARYRIAAYTGPWTVANNNGEVTFPVTVSNGHVIPARTLKPGKVLRVTARGVYSSIATSPGSLTLRIKYGAQTFVGSGGNGLTASMTNRGFTMNVDLICVTAGATGTIEPQGALTLGTNANNSQVQDMESLSTVTLDTTVDQVIGISANFSTADAGNTITLRELTVEELG